MPGPFEEAALGAAPQDQDQTQDQQTEEQRIEQEKQAFFADLKERYGENAPTERTLDIWKARAGRVRWIAFGPEEIYFFRPFKTAEYKGWMAGLLDLARKDPHAADELLKQKVVAACTLFPQLPEEDMGARYAGTVDTLYEQIKFATNFIPFERAVMMVQEW
jgi:hypothetical protein